MSNVVDYFSAFLLGQIVANPNLLAAVPEPQTARSARLCPSHGLDKMRFGNLVHPKHASAADTEEDPLVLEGRGCKV